MRRTLLVLVVVFLAVGAWRMYQWVTFREEKPFDPLAAPSGLQTSPGARLNAMLTEETQAEGEFLRILNAASSDAELREAHQAHEGLRVYAGRLLNLAREAPTDPLALSALARVIIRFPESREARQAADLILRDHLGDEQAGTVCASLAASESDLAAEVLRAIARSNPREAIQKEAEFALATFLKTRAERDGWRDPAKARRSSSEAEGLLEHLVATGGDLRVGRGRLVDLARVQLEALRTRSTDMVAPEIEGEDTDGRPLRLSDYRGKVVVLAFWGHW